MKYDEPAQITIPLGVKVIMEEQAERKGMDLKAYLMEVCTIERYADDEIKTFFSMCNDYPQKLTLEDFNEHFNPYYKGLNAKEKKRREMNLNLGMICQYLKTIGAIVGVLCLLVLVGVLLWAAAKI